MFSSIGISAERQPNYKCKGSDGGSRRQRKQATIGKYSRQRSAHLKLIGCSRSPGPARRAYLHDIRRHGRRSAGATCRRFANVDARFDQV
eukprot:3255990-Pyramimonas_sp.AAC.1